MGSAAKNVVIAYDWQSFPLTDGQENDLVAIRTSIASGASLNTYYRASVTPERLLCDKHVMPFHVEAEGSDVLVYLVQYGEHVLLLCVTTHRHTQSDPLSDRYRNLAANLRFFGERKR